MLERRRMHGASLSNLERGEVESEGLDLPLELEQLPVRRALKPVGGQRLAELDDFAQQLLRTAVRPIAAMAPSLRR
jgi:hypothetical protein